MNIDSLINQFKTEDEMRAFIGSQFKQILQLNKQIKELESQVTELKEKNKTSSLQLVKENIPLTTIDFSVSNNDAKTISQVQLARLKEVSLERELTLEEAKKVSIYNEIIKIREDANKTIKANAKVLNENDLIKLVEDNSGTASK